MLDKIDLQGGVRNGHLPFPVTPFYEERGFAAQPFVAQLEWYSEHPAAESIVAGSAGGLFSLAASEVAEVVEAAVRLRGFATVPVRSSLTELTGEEMEMMQDLIAGRV